MNQHDFFFLAHKSLQRLTCMTDPWLLDFVFSGLWPKPLKKQVENTVLSFTVDATLVRKRHKLCWDHTCLSLKLLCGTKILHWAAIYFFSFPISSQGLLWFRHISIACVLVCTLPFSMLCNLILFPEHFFPHFSSWSLLTGSLSRYLLLAPCRPALWG